MARAVPLESRRGPLERPFRLDHPSPEPTWVHRDLSLVGLGCLWINELSNSGRLHQSQAWCERAVREHWAVFPEDQTRFPKTRDWGGFFLLGNPG